jgi:formylglycine-generating enzyme
MSQRKHRFCLLAWLALDGLALSACGGILDVAGQGSPDDAGSSDERTDCGSSGRPCCDGNACGVGLACSGGRCVGTGDAGFEPPSCASGGPGMTDCGNGSESCCVSLRVPGTTYSRTYINYGSGPSGRADPATVSGFRLDKYLVTVGRFRQFVQAWGSGYRPSAGSGKHTYLNGGRGLARAGATGEFETGWVASDDAQIDPTDGNLQSWPTFATWTHSVGANEERPIDLVNWFEAYAFCIWDGGFLPSDSEWELAAVGGTQQLEYPWGSALPGKSSQYAIYGYGTTTGECFYPSPGPCTGVENIAPVGTAIMGSGTWGQLDLEGEMIAWTLDWYASPYVSPCIDCSYLTPTSAGRVTRGSDFSSPSSFLYPWSRDNSVSSGAPEQRFSDIGFRCARGP